MNFRTRLPQVYQYDARLCAPATTPIELEVRDGSRTSDHSAANDRSNRLLRKLLRLLAVVMFSVGGGGWIAASQPLPL